MPPQPVHGAPRWAWWVVGILVPVLGLVVTLINQSGNAPSHSSPAPPAPAPAASAAPGTSAAEDPSEPATDEPAADEAVTTLSPSPSPSRTSAEILKRGDFSLAEGDSADLEHGTVGPSVASPDMSWSGGDEFSAMNGRVSTSSSGATPRACAHVLEAFPRATGWMAAGTEGTWFCMPTSANHLAAVEWLGSDENGMRFHYIVWATPAPEDA
ncbi:hypothetical protein AB0E77_02590 [Streptomyces sp. NPDC032940]|uniref:hypothetical protein n=1 Tax=Streptomyces sp. NPDC032940 TaxID=3155366 RepID=UPI0033CB873C